MAKLSVDVFVFDENVCKGCKLMKVKTEKAKNTYGDDISVHVCENKDLCARLHEHAKEEAREEALGLLTED